VHAYEAPDYRAFVRHCLDHGTPSRPRSTKKALADHLRVHATFISHVVADKADLSSEQAVRFCDFYGLDRDATDYFVDLLARDRAGDVATRELFDHRLERQRATWLTLQNRLKDELRLTGEDQRRYFESWLLQLVHLACMLPSRNDLRGVTRTLGLPEARIEGALRQLVAMGLLAEQDGRYATQPRRLHLDKTSPTFKTCHGNWRVKIAADVATQRDPAGVHYTSALTISREAADRLRQAVLEHIEQARATSLESSPEEIYVLALDFYPVTPTTEQED
jgi:uncharacterized protein (TIGR02147 family)